MKTLIAIAVSLTIVLAANAAGYDYEVEYVKSAHGSCVKTDLIPEPGLTFKMDIMFEGPFNQIFGGKFDMAKQTTAFFGQEDAKGADEFRDLFSLELGGHEAQAYRRLQTSGARAVTSGYTAASRRSTTR